MNRRFESQHDRPFYRRTFHLYLFFGMLSVAISVGPMTFAQWAFVGVFAAWLPRWPAVVPLLRSVFTQPLVVLSLVWSIWLLITLLWSPAPYSGFRETWAMRWGLLLLALWPLMRYRRFLVGALCAGFLVGNGSQLVIWIGETFDIPWMVYKTWPGGARNIGWWSHPAVCGYMLVPALGLHLPAAIMGSGRTRWLAICGSVATILGMVASGSRGAWLGAAGLIGIVLLIAIRRFGWRAWWRSVRVPLLITILAGAIGGFALWPRVSVRLETAMAEIRRALVEHDYESDTGKRVEYALWAIEAFKEHPIRGVGAGGYLSWVQEHLREQGIDPATVRTAPQAHNLVLHAAATAGLPGVVLTSLIWFFAVWGGLRGLTRQQWGSYAAGPGIAAAGMILISMFDAHYVNSQPSVLTCVLFALCLMKRPPEADEFPGPPFMRWPGPRDPGAEAAL